jgi:integrase
MARTARAGYLETRTARLKLKPTKSPYWTRSGKAGVHLGYRRRRPHGKDANGTWVARRYTGDGAYQTEGFAEADDFSDADGASILTYGQAVQRLGADLSEVQRRIRYSVQNAVNDYLAALDLNAKTAKETKHTLQHYILGFLDPDRPVSDLTRDDFAKWPAWALTHSPRGRRKKAPAPKKPGADDPELLRKRKERINRVMNNVLACFNKAHEDERVASKEAWAKLRRFRGTDQARKHWQDVDGCKRLINACALDFRKIVQAGLLTGARWSEVRSLRAGDYENGTVLIAQSKSNRPRHVYLTDEGKAAFDAWTAGLERSDLIFLRDGGQPWNSHDQHRPMKAACEAAQIKPAVGYHSLRHSYASLIVKNGVSLAIIAEALGHADTRMVSKHYGHLAPSHVAASIRANLPSFGVEVTSKVQNLRSR